jgi:hypothetical protein
MNTLLKKLNFKSQESILILNSPLEFGEMKNEFSQYLGVFEEIGKGSISFALIFCTKLEEVNNFAKQCNSLLEEDALFWFAYPKKSSKKYQCEFNRDNGGKA